MNNMETHTGDHVNQAGAICMLGSANLPTIKHLLIIYQCNSLQVRTLWQLKKGEQQRQQCRKMSGFNLLAREQLKPL